MKEEFEYEDLSINSNYILPELLGRRKYFIVYVSGDPKINGTIEHNKDDNPNT